MLESELKNRYFEWLCGLVCGRGERAAYKRLLLTLHSTEFTCIISQDTNRAVDGVVLRRRFIAENNIIDESPFYTDPCSILEMMVALAVRCEVHIMDDPDIGNRTGQWFWSMVESLGLKKMTDDRFDKQLVDIRIKNFLNRTYRPDGKGGLFTVPNCKHDLRDMEIWYQMCWYLNDLLSR